MLMIDKTILSTVCTGLHLSAASSCGFMGSKPGGCRIEMQTRPSGNTASIYTLGLFVQMRKSAQKIKIRQQKTTSIEKPSSALDFKASSVRTNTTHPHSQGYSISARTVWMPHLRRKSTFWRRLRIIFREFQHSIKESSFIQGIRRPKNRHRPFKQIPASFTRYRVSNNVSCTITSIMYITLHHTSTYSPADTHI